MRLYKNNQQFLLYVALLWLCLQQQCCDAYCPPQNYTVELKATYPDKVVVPCSESQGQAVKSILHSIMQLDALLGGVSSLMLPEFDLAFEAYGPQIRIVPPSAANEFPISQQELALPHMTTQDNLEDLYYQVLEEDVVTADQKDLSKANEKDADEEQQPPPPPLEPMEGSLRASRQFGSDKDGDQSKDDDDSNNRNRRSLGASLHPDGCSTDMCTWYVSSSQELEDASLCPTIDYTEEQLQQQRLASFRRRTTDTIGKKLRKWARDNNIHCLGNSWELQVIVTTTQ